MLTRNIVLSLIVLAIGAFGARTIINMKPEAVVKPQSNTSILVESQRFSRQTLPARIIGQGIVEPAQRINLTAQVSGVVSRVHPELSAGGRVKKGAKLVQLDPTDYGIAVSEAKARLQIAQQELSLEEGRRSAAEREWTIMHESTGSDQVSEQAKQRALRVPQRLIAENNLKIARGSLRRARVGYSRTILSAPFNAVILSETVDKGQLVGPGAPIAQLAGTDEFWVTTSVSTSDLGWIDFPTKRKRRGKRKPVQIKGSEAIIRYDVGAYVIERRGYVVRQLTQVETTGRMARVVIEIPDPLGLKNGLKPLLLGAQVEVEIIGRPIENVVELPRALLHGEDQVWIFTPEPISGGERELPIQHKGRGDLLGTLEIRPVDVLRKRRDVILIREGLADQDEVVTSRIPTPVPGMRLRVQSAE